jgi:hypothetical protein
MSISTCNNIETFDYHDNGELNLKIRNFTRTDEGYYRWILTVNGIVVESDLQVYIKNKLA